MACRTVLHRVRAPLAPPRGRGGAQQHPQIVFDFPGFFLLELRFAYFQPCSEAFEVFQGKYGLGSRLSLIHT
ncbi:hypothetical protein PUN4_270006 [Paraburkholderia unamae]|nr:hypothetical protein PUN4_270006 [Paraburkholderia unamae]